MVLARWKIWIAVFCFWLAVGILSISQTAIVNLANGEPFEWERNISWLLTGWVLWGLLTEPVLRLQRRIPLRRDRPTRGLVLHGLIALMLAPLMLILEALVNMIVWQLAGDPLDPLQRFFSLAKYKYHLYVLVYLAILGADQAWQYYERFKLRETEAAELALRASELERTLATAKLAALQSQLQPHFLFNTHHAIVGLLLKDRNQEAMAMLNRLSDLLRMTLDRGGKTQVRLDEELAFVDGYLAIQQVRFQDRLYVVRDISPYCMHALVPTFAIQPLVENAIRHGIEAKTDAGRLRIEASQDNDQLIIRITDDGPGPVGTPIEGVGLANTRARLKRLFGDQFALNLLKHKDGGATTEMVIPYRTEKKSDENQQEIQP